MDVADMISEMNDHGFTDTASARKVAMLNDALYDISSRNAWPWYLTTATLSFDGTSNAPTTGYPTNLNLVYDLSRTDGSRFYPLTPIRLDDLDKRGVDLAQVGDPYEYYFIGDALNVNPRPGAGTTLRLRYYKVPTAMTDTTLSAAVDLPLHWHRVLTLGALYRLYDLEDDPELSVRFQQHFEQRIDTMTGELIQQVDRPEYIHPVDGFDNDWWD
jgi:hypothetical protein